MGASSSSCYHDSNRITKEELKPGHHIYSWRNAKIYAHHGIYVGDGKVIHFIGGDKNGIVKSVHRSFSSSSSKVGGDQSIPTRVIESSLDCFLSGGNLFIYQYSVAPQVVKEARGGTCTSVASDPSECVLRRARDLLINGFGSYNIFQNNCEDFAIYCKTGLLDVTHVSSGQAASFRGWRKKNFTGDTAFQCLDEIPYNIGVQSDFVKIPVERLIAVSSTDGSESGAHSKSSQEDNQFLQRLIVGRAYAGEGLYIYAGRVIQ